MYIYIYKYWEGNLFWGVENLCLKKNFEVELIGPYLDDVEAIYSDRQNRRGNPTQNGRNIQVKDLYGFIINCPDDV